VDLRTPARLYLTAIICVALSLAAYGVSVSADITRERWILAGAFAVLMAVAGRFDLDFTYRQKMLLDTSVIFAVAMLFEPGIAMSIIGTGSVIAWIWNRSEWYEALFNGAQAMLQVGAASGLLALAGWHTDPLRFNDPVQIALLPVAGVVIYLVNVTAVAGMVALQTGLALTEVWRQSVVEGGFNEVSQVILGLLAAMLVDAHVWSLPLFLLPAVAIYTSLQRHQQLQQQTVDAVEALADIVDLRDPYTANHSRRVAIYVRELATMLDLPPDEVDLIERAARVHDVGKIIIDQVVLTKEGKLADDEWAQLQRHPEIGAQILSRFPEFARATSFVRHHHESLDGRGYPHRLQGDAIPLGARIIAVADSFDAMASARPYRKALPANIVLSEFREKRGQQWDADVVDALLQLIDEERIIFVPTSSTPELLDRHGIPVPLPAAI